MPKGKKGFDKNDPNINKKGRPVGCLKEKTFIEYFNEICSEIADKNGMSQEDVYKIIYKVGYTKAKQGNYSFYKDIMDRMHGRPEEKHDITSGGKAIQSNLSAEAIKEAEILLKKKKIKK